MIAEILEVKVCGACRQHKYRQEFTRRRKSPDGRQAQCKECRKAYQREWAKESPRRKEIVSRSNSQHGARWAREVAERHPEKVSARRKLAWAVNSGKLPKPDICEDCGGRFEKRLLHGHHSDYSKPYDVNWLCAECHRATHNPPRVKGDEKLLKESAK